MGGGSGPKIASRVGLGSGSPCRLMGSRPRCRLTVSDRPTEHGGTRPIPAPAPVPVVLLIEDESPIRRFLREADGRHEGARLREARQGAEYPEPHRGGLRSDPRDRLPPLGVGRAGAGGQQRRGGPIEVIEGSGGTLEWAHQGPDHKRPGLGGLAAGDGLLGGVAEDGGRLVERNAARAGDLGRRGGSRGGWPAPAGAPSPAGAGAGWGTRPWGPRPGSSCRRLRPRLELPRFRGRVPAFGSRHPRGVLDLIAQRRLVVQSRVPPVRVVPPLEEVEDRDPRLSRGREAPAVEELTFQGREEALRHRVVVGVAHRPHRGADPGGLTAEAESEGGVLGGFNWSSQHLTTEVLYGKATWVDNDADRPAGDVVAGPTAGAARCGAEVLGEDRRGTVERGGGDRVWCVRSRWCSLVPRAGWHAVDPAHPAVGPVPIVR